MLLWVSHTFEISGVNISIRLASLWEGKSPHSQLTASSANVANANVPGITNTPTHVASRNTHIPHAYFPNPWLWCRDNRLYGAKEKYKKDRAWIENSCSWTAPRLHPDGGSHVRIKTPTLRPAVECVLNAALGAFMNSRTCWFQIVALLDYSTIP